MKRRQRSALCAAGCILIGGCSAAHRVDAPSIWLVQAEGYPVLTPVVDGSSQLSVQTAVALGTVRKDNCAVQGGVFSLKPPMDGASQWTMTSPSAQGWQVADTASQLRAEWSAFLRDLGERRRAGCFAAALSVAALQQKIVDVIPVPADEALVLRYGFSGEGAVDLQPGMEVQVERSVLAEHGAKRELQSVQADYAVLAEREGVRLKQVNAITLHAQERPDEIFHLDRLTQNATHLRLLLQNLTPGQSMQRPPMLLMGTDDAALRRVTGDVESKGCAAVKDVAGVQCLVFHEAVSLLVGVLVNRKPMTFALGTTLGVALEQQGLDPASATLKRTLADGRVASIVFPQTREGESRIVLQGGDAINVKKVK